MLQIHHISKRYKTGELVQIALNDVSLSFRDCEFVSILGPSGSGKTTLLNMIGGLDRYDSGDLLINGVSTRQYRDRDWDTYRNHSIGFVFQSYHLIPHQSILANVELALTISGISRSESRKRARQALERVGLGDQLHKRPNQMSGGQMQRVAIARALVNDPDILLADEPTGALDSETSLQIMELLREVARDRLVIMVTHNPELAERYSTRIVKLRDGKITSDSMPYEPQEEEAKAVSAGRRASMGFLTSLSLSFNNLRTKKGRTILTSFAGSIGIIGIALILSLSSGVNRYIENIQKDTMTSYPLVIEAETFDLSAMMGSMQTLSLSGQTGYAHESGSVYVDYSDVRVNNSMTASIVRNNLSAFKAYLGDPDSEIHAFLGENGIVYTYNAEFEAYSYDANHSLVNTKASPESLTAPSDSGSYSSGGVTVYETPSSVSPFSELMKGSDGSAVSRIILDNYELLYGAWPGSYDEVILVLSSGDSLSAGTLYQLGLITADEYIEASGRIADGTDAADRKWSYADICAHRFYLLTASDRYLDNGDGTFRYIEKDAISTEPLLSGSTELKISGIVRKKADAANVSISTPIGYTSLLTDYIIAHNNESPVITAQEKTPDINVRNGMKFETKDDAAKIADAKAYLSGLGSADKASFLQLITYLPTQMSPEADGAQGANAGQLAAIMIMPESAQSEMLDKWLSETPNDQILLFIYENYIGKFSYEENLKEFGKVSYDAPSSISIYTDSFEDKEEVSRCIERYNETAEKENRISYTDFVELMTSSLTSIVDVISYVLIAFVAVSLLVSCIMIGIITHISVLERTKEIGILRAIGASRQNISQVFNAETCIIGTCAGLLGIGVSALLTLPINALLRLLLGASSLKVSLPLHYALILVLLSTGITIIGGLLPAHKAAAKDPVIALRSE